MTLSHTLFLQISRQFARTIVPHLEALRRTSPPQTTPGDIAPPVWSHAEMEALYQESMQRSLLLLAEIAPPPQPDMP